MDIECSVNRKLEHVRPADIERRSFEIITSELEEALDAAAGKVAAKVLYAMKDSMNGDNFRECMDCLEKNFQERT